MTRADPAFAGHVAMTDGHEIYAELTGPEDAPRAVFLHGGPGSGCQPAHRALFGPRTRLLMFDQRGAGRSAPRRGRDANTTAHLVADIERLRRHFGIDRWLVVGGSWGATLALAYAQAHPDRVRGLVLRSVFLGTRAELEAVFLDTLPRFYPGLWEDFVSLLTPSERADPLGAYWARILDPDPARHRAAAWAWHDTERILSQIHPAATRLDLAALDNPARGLPATPFMEAHYFRNDCFLDAPLLSRADRLRGIPGVIVQARYDLLCPPATAHALARRWGAARIIDVPDAGHSMDDGGTAEALRAAIADMG